MEKAKQERLDAVNAALRALHGAASRYPFIPIKEDIPEEFLVALGEDLYSYPQSE